jgi:hypothetical protein
MPTEHPINAPFLSKGTNQIESFEIFQCKEFSNYNNRENDIKSLKQSHILKEFRPHISHKTSELYESHVFEHISIIHLSSLTTSMAQLVTLPT